MKYLFFILLLAGCQGCATTTPYTAVLPLNMPQAGLGGQTVCDLNNVPVIVVSKTLLENEFELESVLTHERVHVRQVRDSGDCRAFMFTYTSNVQFRMAQEAEAYCAELDYRVRVGGLGKDYGISRIVSLLTTSERYTLGEEVDSSVVAKLVKGLQGCRPDTGRLGSLSKF